MPKNRLCDRRGEPLVRSPFCDNALVLAPRGRDSALACGLLSEAKIQTEICSDLNDMCARLGADTGFALLTEEALSTNDLNCLANWVAEQPSWSDFPFILVTEKGGGPERNPAAARLLQILGNVIFIERPFHPTTLISVARTALRGRRRQFETRSHLEALRLNEELLEARVAERTQQLKEQKTFLDVMVTSVPAGIVTYDTALRITSWNPFMEKLTGIAAGDVLGRQIIDAAPSLGQEPMQRMQAAVNGQHTQVVEQELVVRETGKHAYYSVQHAPLRSSDGEIIGGVAFMHDITERRRVEGQLRQAQKMEAVGHLTGGVAHDFNNLLTAVLSNLSLIKNRTLDDPRLQHFVDGAIHGAERGAALTQRLLAFARKQDLKIEPTDIVMLVDNIQDLLQRSAGPQTKLIFDFPDKLPLASVDRNQLELALLNLSNNARDAMPDGGEVRITAREERHGPSNGFNAGGYVVLSVQDTGSGMDQSTLQQAIEPFFSTKELGKGTGLGLSMVHGLAIQLGGTFKLRSKVGEGTTAELWLPVSQQQSPVAVPKAIEIAPQAPKASTILVVDDDALIAMSTVDMLEELGHKVLEANSGKTALVMIENNPNIDLMITDHAMPGMTGSELAKAVRMMRPNLPILLASGYADLPDGAGIELPRLGKPYTPNQLVKELSKLLAS